MRIMCDLEPKDVNELYQEILPGNYVLKIIAFDVRSLQYMYEAEFASSEDELIFKLRYE